MHKVDVINLIGAHIKFQILCIDFFYCRKILTQIFHSNFRIRVGRSIQGFGLSPGITKQQRVDVEALMKNAFAKLDGDLAGNYYPLTGMDEAVRQQLVDDHFLFMSGDPNLKVSVDFNHREYKE